MTDWSAYQKCPVCFAELGKPCVTRSGFAVANGWAVGLEGAVVEIIADRPHGGRKLRAGASRG